MKMKKIETDKFLINLSLGLRDCEIDLNYITADKTQA